MIHENLKRIRLHFGATQQELADYLNVSPQSISKWEKGDTYPSIEYLPKMAEFFDCGINTFFSKYELQIYETVGCYDYKDILDLFQAMLTQEEKDTSQVEEVWENTIPVEAMFLPALYEYLQENEYLSMAALQRKLGIGYSLAGRIADALIKMGVVDDTNLENGMRIIPRKVELLLPYIQK